MKVVTVANREDSTSRGEPAVGLGSALAFAPSGGALALYSGFPRAHRPRQQETGRMRIFVENGTYALENLGDIAMLQAALERLRGLWPEASFDVLTTSPERLRSFCPGARPIPAAGAWQWARASKLPDRFGWLAQTLAQQVQNRLPGTARFTALARMRHQGRDTSSIRAFLGAIEGADLVVATGGGYLTDVFEDTARGILGTLTLAIRSRKCTALLGQGLGPLQSPRLRAEAAATLRSVDLIALRESRAGCPLLDELGVSPDRVIITGDDAIEMAYGARQSQIGAGIGINLRVAAYSAVDDGMATVVRSSIEQAAREHQAPFVPIPIATHQSPEAHADARSIRKLVAGLDLAAGVELEPQTPLALIRQIAQCRVVVAGSYHAGVFALSQGIPVVGLARSAYYRDKFLGLSEQFGTGCWIVQLDDDAPRDRIVTAVREAWRAAEHVRFPLLTAARQQVELGYAAHQRLFQLVAERQRRQVQHFQQEKAGLACALTLRKSA